MIRASLYSGAISLEEAEEAYKRGTTVGADDIRKERHALLGALGADTVPREEIPDAAFLRRVYENFTASEVRDICEGRGRHLARAFGARHEGPERERYRGLGAEM